MAAPTLRMLEELPGIADIVWGTCARFDGWPDPVRLMVVSAEPRAGTSVMAAATAMGLVRHLRVPVCLVEANVARPAISRYLGLAAAGLSDVLDGRAELDDCVQESRDCPNLHVLPAGTARAPVAGEFTTEKMWSILQSVGERCRYLVIDAPPVLDHIESRLLLQQVDGALLVVRARKTSVEDAKRAHRILLEAGTPVVGSIFNAYRPEHSFRRGGRESLPSPVTPAREREDGELDLPNLPLETRPVFGAQITSADLETLTDGLVPSASEPMAVASPAGSEEAHRRQVDLLERRIAKLTKLLRQSEENLRRMAALKNIDPGIASMYRGIQGLSPGEDAWAFKKQLMTKIFQANLELKNAVARSS